MLPARAQSVERLGLLALALAREVAASSSCQPRPPSDRPRAPGWPARARSPSATAGLQLRERRCSASWRSAAVAAALLILQLLDARALDLRLALARPDRLRMCVPGRLPGRRCLFAALELEPAACSFACAVSRPGSMVASSPASASTELDRAGSRRRAPAPALVPVRDRRSAAAAARARAGCFVRCASPRRLPRRSAPGWRRAHPPWPPDRRGCSRFRPPPRANRRARPAGGLAVHGGRIANARLVIESRRRSARTSACSLRSSSLSA